MFKLFLSSPEPKAQWWAYRIGRPLSSVCVYVCQHFQTFSSQKPMGQSKSNFICSFHGMGKRKFIQLVQVTWPRWSPCPYMVKTSKKSSSPEPKGRWPWNLVCSIGCLSTTICSNDDPGLILTYVTANLVPYTFVWEKDKTIDFSETIVVYDVKLVDTVN